MGQLDALSTEILCDIMARLDTADARRLRLVSRTIGAVASSIALKEICFTMCKQDFGFLRGIANNPIHATQVTSLAYVVNMLTIKRQTLEMYTDIIHRKYETEEDLHQKHPEWFRRPQGRMTAPEILDHYNQYLRHYEDQDEILTRRLDYDVLKEVTAKSPNLKDIVVSDANELRVIKKSPLSDFVELHLG